MISFIGVLQAPPGGDRRLRRLSDGDPEAEELVDADVKERVGESLFDMMMIPMVPMMVQSRSKMYGTTTDRYR